MNVAPGPSRVLEHELAAHPLGQLAADRQPQAEPGLAGGVAAALEALEDQLALVRGHARALVADAELTAGSPLRGSTAHLGPGRADADRVVEQDAQDPGDAAGVAQRPHRAGRVVERGVRSPRSAVPSSNSASTARLSSPSSTGSERSSTCASMRG